MKYLAIFKVLNEGLIAYFITSIPVIVYAIKLLVDSWGITELEKLRLSNFKKFQIAITKYILIGITFIAIVYLLLIFSEEFKDIKGNLLYGLLAFFFIIFIVTIFAVEKIVRFVAEILSFRYEYHIVNDQGLSVYRIIKLSGNNSLLVESDGIEEFLDSKENRRYKKIRIRNKALEKFYSSKISRNFIFGFAILSIVTFIIVFVTTGWWQFIFYMVFIVSLLLSLILLLNKVENKKYNERLLTKNVSMKEIGGKRND